jgi:AcrR family transcriptional regulator
MGKRAEKLDETRQRIVEAAVELHSSLGPARTTVSQVAQRAGVQRHTYYAHFPDERELYLACSGLALERDPLPDLELLRMLPAGRARVQTGLERLYSWYERNEQLAACVLRDAEHHELTREMVELRLLPFFSGSAHILGEAMGERSQTLLGVALEFRCWRSLSEKMTSATAAELMSDAIACV